MGEGTSVIWGCSGESLLDFYNTSPANLTWWGKRRGLTLAVDTPSLFRALWLAWEENEIRIVNFSTFPLSVRGKAVPSIRDQ